MLDIKFVRENPDAVKENIKKKFQDAKLPLVDEVIEKDAKYRAALKEVEALKAARNKLSKANGPLFGSTVGVNIEHQLLAADCFRTQSIVMLKRHSGVSEACDRKGAVADRIAEQIVSIGLHADSAYRVKGYVVICPPCMGGRDLFHYR